ncbi:MAG: FitA-like ribbon-helix-helix domain-containing protein [Terriglobales bacterium]
MAQILVRKLAESTKSQLRQRAERHGRSVEAEARAILTDAARQTEERKEGFGTRWARTFAGHGLRPGEDIPEMRGMKLRVPDFRE